MKFAKVLKSSNATLVFNSKLYELFDFDTDVAVDAETL